MRFFHSKILNDTIIILEDGDPSMGWVVTYSPKEIERIEKANLSNADKRKLHLFKKVFGLSESEWRFDGDNKPVRSDSYLQGLSAESSSEFLSEADEKRDDGLEMEVQEV